jgi:hypothetical protein
MYYYWDGAQFEDFSGGSVFTWSGPRGVAGYTEVLAVGEAIMPTGPLGSLTPYEPSWFADFK